MNDNLQKLYGSLQKLDKEFTRSYDEFVFDMLNEDNRKRLHNSLGSLDKGFTRTYDEFAQDMGFSNAIPKVELPVYTNPFDGIKGGVSLPGRKTFADAATENYESRKSEMQLKRGIGAQLQSSLDDITRKRGDAYVAAKTETMPMQPTMPGDISATHPMFNADKNSMEFKQYDAAQKYLQEAQSIINEAEKSGGNLRAAGRAFKNSVFNPDTWDGGMRGLNQSGALLSILNKAESGKELNESEQSILDASALNLAVKQFYSSDIARGYKWGQIAGESLPFMLEMLLNPLSGSGKGIAKRLATYGVKRFGANTAGKVALKAGARFGGDLLAAGAMTATSGLARTAAGAMNRVAGESTFELNDEGKSTYAGHEGGENALSAILKEAGAQTLEYQSEMLGNSGLGSVLGNIPIVKKLGKGVKATGIGRAFGKLSESGVYRNLKALERKAQWSGTLGEYGEEVYGQFMNALFIGDNKMSDLTNIEEQADIFMGLALTGGAVSGMNTAGYALDKSRIGVKKYKADKIASGEIKDWEKTKSAIDNMGVDERKQELVKVLQDTGISNKGKKAFADYVSAKTFDESLTGSAQESTANRDLLTERIVNPALPEDMDPTDAANHIDTRIGVLNARHVMDEALADVDYTIDERIEMSVEEQKAIVQDVMSNDVLSQEQKQSVINYITAAALDRNLQQAKQARLQEQTAQAAEAIRDRVNETTGTLVTARIKGAEGNPVQITKGLALRKNPTPTLPQGEGVSLDESGDMFEIDAENSHKEVYYIDENGDPQVTTAENLELAGNEDVETSIAQMSAMAQQQDMAQQMEIDAAVEAYMSESEGRDGDLETGRQETGDEVISAENLPEISPEEAEQFDKVQPVGKSFFGDVFDQFKGKAREAAKFLFHRKGGDAIGVFNRKELGDIDLVWGSHQEKSGFEHIIEKHINEQNDFKNIDEAIDIIGEVVSNGAISRENQDKIVIDKDGYRVVVGKQIRDNSGNIITSKNWVITGFDTMRSVKEKTLSGETLTTPLSNLPADGVTLPSNSVSENKDNTQESGKQETEQEFPRDNDGNVDYNQISDDATYIQALQSEFGEDAAGIVEEYKNSAEKALKAVNKIKDPIKRRREQAKRQAELDRWTNMYEQARPKEQIPRYEEKRNPVVYENNRKREAAMGEYLSLRDYLLRNIGNGTFRFMWNSRDGRTGLKDEILSSKNAQMEMMKRIAFLDNNGFTPESLAHYIWDNRGAVIPEAWAADDAEIRNEINDILLSHDTPTMMIDAAEALRDKAETIEEYYEQVDPEVVADYEANEASQNELLSDLPEHQLPEVSKQEVESLRPPREELNSIAEIEDTDFDTPYRDIIIPSLPDNVGDMINANGRKLLIKKIILDKNNRNHPEIGSASEQKEILNNALYEPDMVVSANPASKPNYWIVVKIGDKYANATLDADPVKDFVEVINWHWLNEDTFEKKKKRAIREGGQVLISNHVRQQSYSDLPDNSIRNKDSAENLNDQTNQEKKELTPRKYNALDKVTINGEEHTISEAGTYVGTNDHFYTLEKDGEVAHEDISGEELEALIERKADENKDVKEDKESGQPIDIIEHARNVVKNEELRREGEKVNPNPTEAQKEAGNYQKGHVNVQGFDITIENPRGSERSGVDENGKPWSVTMQNHYGYFKRTQGKDGDQIDVFVGANPESAKVFVVDQNNTNDGTFDESKVMLGFNSVEEAREAYLSNYEDGWQGLGAITETNAEDFKKWLYDGAKQRKAFGEYKENIQEPKYHNLTDNDIKNLSDSEIDAIEDKNNAFINTIYESVIGEPIETRWTLFVEKLREKGVPQTEINDMDYNEESNLYIDIQNALIEKIGAGAFDELERNNDRQKKEDKIKKISSEIKVDAILKQKYGNWKYGNSYDFNYFGFRVEKAGDKYNLTVYTKRKGGQAYNPYYSETHKNISEAKANKIISDEARRMLEVGMYHLSLSDMSNALADNDVDDSKVDENLRRENRIRKTKVGWRLDEKLSDEDVRNNPQITTIKDENGDMWAPVMNTKTKKELTDWLDKKGIKGKDTLFQQGGKMERTTPKKLQQVIDLLKKTGLAADVKTGQEFWDRLADLTGDETFRKRIIANDNDLFNKELDDFKAGTHKGLLHLGTPLEKLRAAGVNANELTLSPTVLNRKLKQHGLTTDDLKGLSGAMQNPILVYRHGLNIPNIVVVTELDVKGGKLSVSVALDTNGNVLAVDNVSSIHSKDAVTELIRLDDYTEEQLRNALGWVEKEKVLDWFSTAPLYGGMHTVNPKLNSIAKIIESFDNPKISGENRFHAVWHGSPHAFKKFSLGKIGTGEGLQAYGYGLYFTDKEGIAKTYALNNHPDNLRENKIINDLALGELESHNGDKQAAIDYLTSLLQEDWADKKRVKKQIKILETGKFLKEPVNNLYKVTIHGDKTIDELNFLRWDKPLSNNTISTIKDSLLEDGFSETDGSWPTYIKENKKIVINPHAKGADIYTEISESLGSDKAASEFLLRAGIDGIQYPAEFTTKGTHEEAYNYVVFDENALEIEEHIQFMKRPDGTVYGFVDSNNVIYLNPDEVNLNTPIHEYGHLWVSHIRKNYPDLYERAGEVFGDSEYLKQVKADKNYAHLNEEQQLDEAIARAIGDKGESVAKGDIGMLARIKNWINDVWRRIGAAFGVKNLTPDKISRLTWQDITDIGVSELLGGEKLGDGRQKTEVDVVDATSEHGFKDFNDAKEWAKKNIARTYSVEETGGKGEIRISNNSIEKYLSQSAVDKSENKDVHLSVLKVLPDVIKTSIDADQHADYKKINGERKPENGVNENVTIHRLYGAVRIGEDTFRVKTTLKEFKDKNEPNTPHSYEATKIELLAGTLVDTKSTNPNTNNSISVANLLKGVEKSYEKGKYLLDDERESGETRQGDGAMRQGDDIRFSVGEKPKYTNQPVGDFAQENARFNAVDRISDIKDAAKADEVRAKLADIDRRMEGLNRRFSRNEVSRNEYAKQKSELARESSNVFIEINNLTGGWKKAKGEGHEKRIVAPREVGLQQKIELQQGYERAAMRKYAQEIAQAARNSQIEDEVSAGVLAAENTRVKQIIAEIEAMDKNEEIVPIDRRETNWLEIAKQRASAKRQQENLPKIKQAAKDIKDLIDTAIGKDIVDMMSERDFKSLINRLETATSTGSLKAAVKAINQAIMRITLRKNNEIINGLINGKIVNTHAIYSLNAALQSSESVSGELGDAIDDNIFRLLSGINAYNRYFEIQGKSKRGVSVAKNVDEGTREIIQFVRDNYAAPKQEIGEDGKRKRESFAEREERLSITREKLADWKKAIDETKGTENYKYSEGDARKLIAIDLLNRLIDINDVKTDIRELQGRDWQEFNRENPDKWKWEAVLERQKDLEKLQMELIGEFTDLIELGRSKLTEWKEAEAARNYAIADEAIAAVKDKRIKNQGEEKRQTNWERMKEIGGERVLKTILSPLGSFNWTLKYIDRNHLMGEGPMYNRFMKGPDGVLAAQETYNDGLDSFKREAASKAEEIFGKKFRAIIADSRKDSGAVITYKLFDKKGENGELEAVTTTVPMTKGELMYIYMTWQQAEGREKLENMLIEQSTINDIEKTLGEKYIRYADWVQKEFLPSRRVKYNETHKRVFGTSMAEVENYFPLRYDKKQHVQEKDVGESINYGIPGTMTGAIFNRIRNKKDIALDANAFDLLMENGQEMEEWSAYAQLRKDLNALLSNLYFKNLLEANNKTSFDMFLEASKIATRAKKDNVLDAESLAGKLNAGFAGAAIAFRLNTALKQLLSYPAFMAYSGNPKYQLSLVKNIVNPFTVYKNYRWAMEELPGFRERVASGAFGNEKLLATEWRTSEQASGKRKFLGKSGVVVNDAFSKYREIGMMPNKWVDAVSFSAGAKAVYDYKKSVYEKHGMDAKEAHERAVFDAAIAANESQQSAEDAFLSPIQKSQTAYARTFTTFMNSNFGYLRKGSEGVIELKRILKDRERFIEAGMSELEVELSEAAARSKIKGAVSSAAVRAIVTTLMYKVVLNTIWQSVEPFLWGTGDDDDEKEAELTKAILLSPFDNVLFGGMIRGVLDGYEPRGLLDSEISKAFKQIKQTYAQEESLLSKEMAVAVTKTAMKSGGFNFDTWMNAYRTYEKGIKEKGGAAMAYQYFTNVPQSIRIETAKKIKEGESLADYAHRVSLAYENEKRFEREMNSIILKYAFNDGGDMTQFNRAYEMAKEWEKLKKDPDKKPERYKELEKINRNEALSDLSSYVSGRLKSYKKDLNRKRSDEDMKEDYATVRGLVEEINKEGIGN